MIRKIYGGLGICLGPLPLFNCRRYQLKNVIIAVATATISAVGTADTTDLFPAIAPDQVEGVPYVYAVESNIAMPGQGANFNVIYADIDGDFRFDYVGTDGSQINLDNFHFTGVWDSGVNLLTQNAINAINDTIDQIVRFAPEYTEQNADGSYTMLLNPSSTVAIPSSSDPRPAQVQPKALPWGVGNFTHTDGITQDVFYCDPPMCTSICTDPQDLSMTFSEVRKMVKRIDDLFLEEYTWHNGWDVCIVVPVGTEIYNYNTIVEKRRTVAAGLLSLGDGRTDTCDAYDVLFISIEDNSNAKLGLAYKCKGNKLTFDAAGEIVPEKTSPRSSTLPVLKIPARPTTGTPTSVFVSRVSAASTCCLHGPWLCH